MRKPRTPRADVEPVEPWSRLLRLVEDRADKGEIILTANAVAVERGGSAWMPIVPDPVFLDDEDPS